VPRRKYPFPSRTRKSSAEGPDVAGRQDRGAAGVRLKVLAPGIGAFFVLFNDIIQLWN